MSTTEKEKGLFCKRTLLGFTGFIVFIIVLALLFPFDYYRNGIANYQNKDYRAAYASLAKVRLEDPHYVQAAAILVKIKPKMDSLQRIEKL
jgi:hypothetical protein